MRAVNLGKLAKLGSAGRGLVVGIAVGVAVGLLIGSVGVAYSTMGKAGWDKQPVEFKLGYLAGFTDVVRMAKGTDPGGQIAQSYKIPQTAKLINWLYQVETMFEEEKHAPRNISQIIAFAGAAMEREFGGDVTTVSGMEQLAAALKNRREALARGDIKPSPPDVVARRQAIAARNNAFSQCMGSARKSARTRCKTKVRETMPPIPELKSEESSNADSE